MERGLSRDDLFTVVSEQFLTDTAIYADIVLPATTQLEQFDVMFSWGHLYLTLNEPAVAPLGEAVPNTELFRRLARDHGVQRPYWQRSDEEMAMAALDWSNPVLDGHRPGVAAQDRLCAPQGRHAGSASCRTVKAIFRPRRANASSSRR